jgi:hypothetical protein
MDQRKDLSASALRALPSDPLSREALAELKAKYEEMLRMRLHDQAHPGGDPRLEMAALAARFPGALRELDEAPLELIRTRIDALSRCVDGSGSVEPWMPATAAFHRLTRGALATKRWLGGRKIVDPELSAEFRRFLTESPDREDAEPWAPELALVASPPSGKLTELVFERVAARLGIPLDEARALVVGPRKTR